MRNTIFFLFFVLLTQSVVAQDLTVVDQIKYMYLIQSSTVESRPIEGCDAVQISVLSFTLDSKTLKIAKTKQAFVQMSGLELERFENAVAMIEPNDSALFFVFAPTLAVQRNGFKVSSGEDAMPVVTSYGKMTISPSRKNFLSMADLNKAVSGYTWGVSELEYTVLYPKTFRVPGKDKLIYQTVVPYYIMEKSTDSTKIKIRKKFSVVSFDDSATAVMFENPTAAKKIRFGPAEWGRDGMFTTPSDSEWDDRARDDWLSKRRSLNLYFDSNNLFPPKVEPALPEKTVDSTVFQELAKALDSILVLNNLLEAQTTTSELLLPIAPTVSENSSGIYFTATSLTTGKVYWDFVAGTSAHVIYIEGTDGRKNTYRKSATEMVFQNLKAGFSYTVTVEAKNDAQKVLHVYVIEFSM